MISDEDITKLKEVFPTRKEFTILSNKVDGLDVRFDGLQEQVGDLKIDMGEMNDKMDVLLEKLAN